MNRRSVLLIIGLVLVLSAGLLVGCIDELMNWGKKEDPIVPAGAISGRVVDENSGEAIAGATVSTDPPTSTVITDASGNYTISDVKEGSYTVKASKSGYLEGSVEVSVVSGGTAEADVQLKAPNYPPVIHGISYPQTVAVGETPTITVDASDPDDDPLTYTWAAPDGGTISGTGQSITWTAPTTTGTFTISVSISDDINEPVSQTVDISVETINTVIKVDPYLSKASAGNSFTVNVKVENVSGLFGVSFELKFNQDVLEATEALNGDFLGSDVIFYAGIDPGSVGIGISRKAEAGGVDGDGVIAVLTFKAISAGETDISFYQNTLKMQDSTGAAVQGFEQVVAGDGKVIIQ